MSALNWQNVTPSNSPKFLVRGTELNRAIVPGTLSRFQVCELRTVSRSTEGLDYDREYVLRDAATVTLEQVAAASRPAIVGRFPTLDAALDAALKWASDASL